MSVPICTIVFEGVGGLEDAMLTSTLGVEALICSMQWLGGTKLDPVYRSDRAGLHLHQLKLVQLKFASTPSARC